MKTAQRNILVIGGTGKTGRRIVQRLEAGGHPARVGSRSGSPAFDWTDRQTWPDALREVRSIYLSYYPDLAIPGAVETVQAFIELALKNGIRRLVLLSGRGEEQAQRAERVLQTSGADWTILRCSWFAQNFSENFLMESVLDGEVVLPAGDIAEPFIDAEDIADVALAALTEDRHGGQLYELTGPRLLTFAEAVAEIARATGRKIRYTPISLEAYADSLAGLNLPHEFTWLLNYLFGTVLDGRNAHLSDGVRRALGRAPRDFSEYARETATSGVWDSVSG